MNHERTKVYYSRVVSQKFSFKKIDCSFRLQDIDCKKNKH